MNNVALYQALIFTLYISAVAYFYGVQPSISETWYAIKHRILFSLFCFSLGILNCLHGGWWFFIAGGGLCFVGGAAHYKQGRFAEFVHYSGALVAIIFSIIGSGFYWALVPIGLAALIKDNRIWWIEVVAFYSIILYLI